MRRRRGMFDALPRMLLRRSGTRFIDVCAAAATINGVVVAGWGVIILVLYVDVTPGELALFAACSVAAAIVEGLVAARDIRAAGAPATAWLRAPEGVRDGGAAREAWSAAAQLPLALLRRPLPYVVGVAGAAGTAFALAALLDLPAGHAGLALAPLLVLYLCSAVLRALALEISMRPLLEAIGTTPRAASPARVSIHARLLATVPMITWGAGLIVAGLMTDDTRDLDTIGLGAVVALGVTAAVSLWLSVVLADAVSGPVADLRDATRRVGGGDLSVRVPVVSTDETGELAASFNAMVAGLGERERLRRAFGTFVDPALAERVLREGTDLRGEEVELSVLVLDARGFTEFAEQASAHRVVGTLNALFEAVVPVIARHGGHVNKFMGDGLLAVFGAPDRVPDHAARAVAAAREIARLAREDRTGGLRVGVGVNTGRVVVGTIGGGERRDFTVVGDAVNTAARVEAATRVTGDDVLVTDVTLRALGPDAAGDFEERAAVPLRGKAATVRLYAPRPG